MIKYIKLFLVSLILLNGMTACTKIDESEVSEKVVDVIESEYFKSYEWVESTDEDISLLIVEPGSYSRNFSVLSSKLIAMESSKFVWTPGRMPNPEGEGTYELNPFAWNFMATKVQNL